MSYCIGITTGIGASIAASFLAKTFFKSEEPNGTALQDLAASSTAHALANLVVERSPFWEGFSHGASFSSYYFCHVVARTLGSEHLKAAVSDHKRLDCDPKYQDIKCRSEKNSFMAMFIATTTLLKHYPNFSLNMAIAALSGYQVASNAYSEYSECKKK